MAPPSQEGPFPIWKALFTPERKTLIVPGDAALDMFVIWEQRSLTLEQYAAHNYERESKASLPPSHTSMGSTYGALNFLTGDWLYAPVLQQATDSSGHPHDFEVLLSGDFLHGGVGNSKVITLHVH